MIGVNDSYSLEEVEKYITAFCKSTLHLTEIGIDDNFFEVGFDSLLVASLVFQIKKNFNIYDFPIQLLFINPNIRGLSIDVYRLLRGDIEENVEQ